MSKKLFSKFSKALKSSNERCRLTHLSFQHLWHSFETICGVTRLSQFYRERFVIELLPYHQALLGPVLDSLGATHVGNTYQIFVINLTEFSVESLYAKADALRQRLDSFDKVFSVVKQFGECEIRYGINGPEVHFRKKEDYSDFLNAIARCSSSTMTFEEIFYSTSEAFLSQFKSALAEHLSKKTTKVENQDPKPSQPISVKSSVQEEPHRFWALKPVDLNERSSSQSQAHPLVQSQLNYKDLRQDLKILLGYYEEWKQNWDENQSESPSPN